MEKDLLIRQLSIEEGQIVFQALAELPFKYVYELIGRMNQVTNGSDPVIRDGSVCYTYTFTPRELALVRAALGRLPYSKVFRVIQTLETDKDHDPPS